MWHCRVDLPMSLRGLLKDLFVGLFFLLIFLFVILFTLVLKRFLKNKKIQKIGAQGEKDVSLMLSKLRKNKYHVIDNVMLKHANGKTSQIDHIVVSQKGIFVIETKNYSGIVKGDLNKQWWTHTCGKNKHVVYNIVYQNQGHVKAVKNSISDVLLQNIGYRKYKKFFFSVLVFKTSCILKIRSPFFYRFKLSRPKFKICNSENVVKYIKKTHRRNVISKKLYKQLIVELQSKNVFSKKNFKTHLKQVKF